MNGQIMNDNFESEHLVSLQAFHVKKKKQWEPEMIRGATEEEM